VALKLVGTVPRSLSSETIIWLALPSDSLGILPRRNTATIWLVVAL
jgi:hypothetical protein